jgi:DNA-binding NarL/FixJ family response regulator
VINPTPLLFWLAVVYIPVAAVVCGLFTWRIRRQAAQSAELASTLAERLAAAEKKLEKATQQIAEQERRLNWIELRARPNRAASESAEDNKSARKGRPSMTERRHRVLSLARRGVDAEQIAETLGMPYGEVELIISLNSAA